MIQLICEPATDINKFNQLIRRWKLRHDPSARLALMIKPDCITLKNLNAVKTKDVIVDFISDKLTYRRHFGGGQKEAIAKAIGIKGNRSRPTVIDATAGLGRDAFVLASLGCNIMLFERHPIACVLLEDGLRRAYADQEIGPWMRERVSFCPISSFDGLCMLTKKADVIYLDPMFPVKQKRALVKKEMSYFQLLIGWDSDADELLSIACRSAKQRVVVKRPIHASFLAGKIPNFTVKTKKYRFDVYLSVLSVKSL